MKRRKCTKLGYLTRGEAENAIANMTRKFGPFTFKRAYWCGRCRRYHITSTPPLKGRRKQW